MAAVRLAGTGVLVQRMNAVESISHVDVLCVDKTGTITTNRLALEALEPLGLEREDFSRWLGQFAASAAYANRTLDGIRQAFPSEAQPVAQEIPFESSRKWSALLFADAGVSDLYVLGAPEVLAGHCSQQGALDQSAAAWARRGLRVLLLARRAGAQPFATPADPELPDGLEPLGLVVLRDETRPDAGKVVGEFQAAGIDLKIISGDHPETSTWTRWTRGSSRRRRPALPSSAGSRRRPRRPWCERCSAAAATWPWSATASTTCRRSRRPRWRWRCAAAAASPAASPT
jgi:cation-transporting ATPase E